MAALDDVVSNLLSIAKNIGSLIGVLQTTLPRVSGTFTLGAAATTVVPEPAVRSNSIIMPIPTNASAATLQGSAKYAYVSVKTVGVSFTVATANGTAAAGTETFTYQLMNPV
jgi:hypothetical protein